MNCGFNSISNSHQMYYRAPNPLILNQKTMTALPVFSHDPLSAPHLKNRKIEEVSSSDPQQAYKISHTPIPDKDFEKIVKILYNSRDKMFNAIINSEWFIYKQLAFTFNKISSTAFNKKVNLLRTQYPIAPGVISQMGDFSFAPLAMIQDLRNILGNNLNTPTKELPKSYQEIFKKRIPQKIKRDALRSQNKKKHSPKEGKSQAKTQILRSDSLQNVEKYRHLSNQFHQNVSNPEIDSPNHSECYVDSHLEPEKNHMTLNFEFSSFSQFQPNVSNPGIDSPPNSELYMDSHLKPDENNFMLKLDLSSFDQYQNNLSHPVIDSPTHSEFYVDSNFEREENTFMLSLDLSSFDH